MMLLSNISNIPNYKGLKAGWKLKHTHTLNFIVLSYMAANLTYISLGQKNTSVRMLGSLFYLLPLSLITLITFPEEKNKHVGLI